MCSSDLRARAAGRRAWVTEAQAEPWQAWPAGEGPVSAESADLGDTVGRLRRAGFDTVFLWGAEHWLAEEAAGRPEWISAVRALR